MAHIVIIISEEEKRLIREAIGQLQSLAVYPSYRKISDIVKLPVTKIQYGINDMLEDGILERKVTLEYEGHYKRFLYIIKD